MNDTQVTLCKGGTAEKTVKVWEIVIPDLWHVHQRMLWKAQKISTKTQSGSMEREDCLREAKAVLECWHLAHHLKEHIEAAP